MKYFCRTFFFLMMLSTGAFAHHTDPSASTSSRFFLNPDQQSRPASRFFLAFEFTHLDAGVADFYNTQLGGEWAFHKRASVFGSLPISVIDHHFESNSAGMGDLNLGVKWLLAERKPVFVFLSTRLSLPTGSQSQGLGSGKVRQSADVFIGFPIKNWLVFVSPSFEWNNASQVEPTLHGFVGIQTPTFFKRLSAGFTLHAHTFLASESFESGSFELFLEPQLNIVLDKKEYLSLNLLARISVLDSISKKAGVVLIPTSKALLSDVQFGLVTTLNVRF